MNRPEITWSILHPTPLDPEYVERLVSKAEEYTVDSFEICGECHSPYGGLDGFIDYREYPHAFASWNQRQVVETRKRMNEILQIAHAAGKKVYYFHREVMLPPGMLLDLPELLDVNGEFDLQGNAFARLIAYKIDRAFAAVPELDGLVLTLTEADFSAIHNSDPSKYPPVKVVEFMIRSFARELAVRGKRFVLRSFGSIAQDYEDILAGAARAAKEFSFEVETKITPYDFDPYLPPNHFLRHIPNLTVSAECECVGEFMGQGNVPFEHVHNLVRYVREGQEFGVDRFTIRIDRRGNSIFDLYEINYYAYDRALADMRITADGIRREWYEKHYPALYRDVFIQLDKIGWEMVTRMYFIDHQVMFHGNYALKYLKAGFIFALFHDNKDLHNGRGVWSILTDRRSPGRERILKEKEEAYRLAREGLALYESLHLDDYRARLWRNAVLVAKAALALCRAIASYFEDMEQNHDDPAALRTAVTAALHTFDELAGHALSVRKHQVVNGLEHRVNEVNRTLEEICLEPFSAICRALVPEYEGERRARKNFLSGSRDGVVAGGIYDDIRIYRYMHASGNWITNKLRMKTKVRLEIPILPPLAAFLEEQRVHTGDQEFVCPELAEMYQHNRSGLVRRIKEFLEGIGIKTASQIEGRSRAVSTKAAHAMRHTFAYLAGVYNVPQPIVQSVLGHMTPRMTELYQQHTQREQKEKFFRQMPNVLG